MANFPHESQNLRRNVHSLHIRTVSKVFSKGYKASSDGYLKPLKVKLKWIRIKSGRGEVHSNSSGDVSHN